MIGSKIRSGGVFVIGLASALAGLAGGSAACSASEGEGGTSAPPESVAYFAGDVEGSSARVGVALASGRVLLFLCGGADDPGDTAWVSGSIDGAGALALPPGEVTIAATRAGDTIEGTLTRPRGSSRFRAALLQHGELGGLWEAREPDGRVGLVVEPPGEGALAQGVFLSKGLAFQVTPIRPLQPIEGLLRVRVPALDRTVSLRLAVP